MYKIAKDKTDGKVEIKFNEGRGNKNPNWKLKTRFNYLPATTHVDRII